ncbi:hypothetical protein [Streptomyces sp. NPDC053560]|uniref:hypothetical protein n=1 Tax=Streptomyces sp. NPDC053560 TaxID=3365711 RepID=UPI0037D0FFC2
MLSYAAILDANFSHLSTAVEKWQKLPGKMDAAASAFRTKVSKGLRDSDWEGDTAKAAFDKFDAIEKELKAASDEAKDIHGLLETALERFKSAKSRLESVRTDVRNTEGLRISEAGRVDVEAEPGSKAYDKEKKKHAEAIEHFRERINRARKDATEADQALSWALQQDPNGAKRGFNTAGADSMKDALAGRKEAAKDADAAVKLASMDELSDKQLAHLNSYLAKHKDDPFFSERFATELGPKKTLEFWRGIADPGAGKGPQADPDRLKAVAKLQDNLSLTLATATRADTPAMHHWENSVIKLGDNQFHRDGSMNEPFGYQIMSNLMRKGDFDDRFLDKYGKSLLHFENQQQEKNGMGPEELWMRNRAQLNFGADNDYGGDPMTGLMESLGHSPDASTDFFNSKFEGGDGKDRSVFNYLVKGGDNNREWPVDNDGISDDKVVAGYKSLGHALESATIGYPYDDKTSGAELTDHRNKDTAAVMKKVIAAYIDDGDLMNKQQGIADSLGRMGAAYIDDINYGVSDLAFDAKPGETRNDSPFKATYPGALNIKHDDAVDFLTVIARDKDAHTAVSMANGSYSLSVMMANPPHRDDYGMLHYDNALEAARVNGNTQSILDHTIANQICSDLDAEAEDQIASLEKSGEWAGLGVGAVTGIGVGLINPAAGAVLAPVAADVASDTLGEAANTLFSEEYGEHVKSEEKKLDPGDDKKEVLNDYFANGKRKARIPGDIYAQNIEAQGGGALPEEDRDTLQTMLKRFSTDGYGDGRDMTESMGIDPYEHKEEDKWFGIF